MIDVDKKIYEKTRYDNIYRHKKNKNYVIMISKPVKTSVSKINGSKIYDINIAKDYKMKIALKLQSSSKQANSNYFKDLWKDYIYYCENVSKLAYNTLKKKKTIYNCYLKDLDNYKLNDFTKQNIAEFINQLIATDKQKNTTLIMLNGFLNWCADGERNYLIKNPAKGIKQIKTPKSVMKYWNTEEFSKFIKYMKSQETPSAKMITIFTLIGLYIGDRIGETRALTWSSIDEINNTISLSHSINYDPNSTDYLSTTKNYQSDRVVDVSPNLIKSLIDYKEYLIEKYEDINDIIFYNYVLKKPYSDTNLRKHFYNYCDKAEVKRIRPYDLRHTFVTMMMTEGYELYHISPIIGHINYSTTVNKYGHLESKKRKEIAKTTDKYL